MIKNTPLKHFNRRVEIACMKRICLYFMIASTIFSTTSCMVGPEYKKPELPQKEQFKNTSAEPITPSEVIRFDWWADFNDPYLNQLIQDSVAANYTLKILFERIKAAGATTKTTQADLLPSLGLSTEGTDISNSSQTGTTQSYNIRAGVSWELDFWGKKRREVQALQAEQKALEAEYRAGYLKMVTEVASDYFQIRQLDEQIDFSQIFLQENKQILTIYQNQLAEGLISDDKVIRQKAQVQELEQDNLENERNRKIQENHLATLMGKPAGEFQIKRSDTSKRITPVSVPVGLPSELLKRRPDILAAEYRVLKAVNMVGSAEAARFPSISLTASGGFASAALSSLLSGGIVGFTPQILLPIFDAGKNKQKIEMKKSEAKIAADEYCQTVMLAFEEIENALINIDNRKKQQNILNKRIENLETIRKQNISKLELGLISQLELLDIEREIYSAKKAMPLLERYILDDTITLYKALGGGWPKETVTN